MDDLISRSDLLTRMCQKNCGERQCVDAMDRCVWYYYIKNQPTVDAEEVVHGEWMLIENDFDAERIECMLCGASFYDGDNDTFDNPYNYCPNCGAKMDGGE